MPLRINGVGPDFTAETTQGLVHFHEWIGKGWAIHTSAFCDKPSSNNPKNLPFSSRMDVSRLGGDHLAECDDKETRRKT